MRTPLIVLILSISLSLFAKETEEEILIKSIALKNTYEKETKILQASQKTLKVFKDAIGNLENQIKRLEIPRKKISKEKDLYKQISQTIDYLNALWKFYEEKKDYLVSSFHSFLSIKVSLKKIRIK